MFEGRPGFFFGAGRTVYALVVFHLNTVVNSGGFSVFQLVAGTKKPTGSLERARQRAETVTGTNRLSHVGPRFEPPRPAFAYIYLFIPVTCRGGV